ncbi:MAG: tetratricopeptide repeat protein [Parcubacteria group bacterium]
MNQTYKLSILSVLLVALLLPIFFLPVAILPLGVVKATLLTLGVVTAFVGFIMKVISRGGFVVPSTYLMWMTVLLPLVYLLSAWASSNTLRSLYGYNLETGTFGFILLVSILFGIVTVAFSDIAKIYRVLGALLISFALITVFAVVKIISGGAFPVWGAFFSSTANPVGSWSDYAMLFSLVAIVSSLALSVLPLKKSWRLGLIAMFFISMLLMAIMNFSTTFTLTLISSILVLAYLLKVDPSSREVGETKSRTLWPSVTLVVVSLLFVINPMLSATYGTLSDTVSGAFGVSNVEVRPSLTATWDISKAVIRDNLLFGTGPSTFSENWLLYKPQEINNTLFWNTSFPSGIGFILTQVASVGLLGSLVWLVFFALLLVLMLKALARVPEESWERFALISTLFAVFFLWTASFVYVPSVVMLTLTFLLTGLFVASCRALDVVPTREIAFSRNTALNFVSVIVMVGIGISVVMFGFNSLQRTVSAYHFQKALVLSNTEGTSIDDISDSLVRAMRLVPQDIYYSAFSELSVARAESILNRTEGTQEENLALFQEALSNSVVSAREAVNLNPESYRNWVVLGSIYSSLVSEPFSVEGAFEEAEKAFQEARLRNPQSPEVPLLLARLELNNDNADGARVYLDESIALKEDYADAYFLLTQIEIEENNIAEAIRSTETSAILSPDNAGVFFQLGLLKYSLEDWSGAVSAYEQALRLVPEYANAKYFLGLSLSELGRSEEAIAHFEGLAESNPDNLEVGVILENLREGREPLFGIPSADVEDRSLPPITDGDNN